MARRKKEKDKHNLWKRLHFKYRLSILNENTLEEVARLQSSIFTAVMLVLTFAITLVAVTSIVIISTPIRNYLPGYSDAEVRGFALKNALVIDSLQRVVKQQATYVATIRSVFDSKVVRDTATAGGEVNVSENDPSLQPSETERAFNEQYQKEEKYNLSVQSPETKALTEGVVFFRPLKGVVSAKYNPAAHHFGIDLVAQPKENVVAVLEGTVIFSGFEPNAGYFIQVQHRNGFVSVYQQNEILLKKAGDRVRTGEAIALVGNTGKESKAVHLHFELWYKGTPVNPESYVTF